MTFFGFDLIWFVTNVTISFDLAPLHFINSILKLKIASLPRFNVSAFDSQIAAEFRFLVSGWNYDVWVKNRVRKSLLPDKWGVLLLWERRGVVLDVLRVTFSNILDLWQGWTHSNDIDQWDEELLDRDREFAKTVRAIQLLFCTDLGRKVKNWNSENPKNLLICIYLLANKTPLDAGLPPLDNSRTCKSTSSTVFILK